MDWELKGTVVIACNCDYGCPCNFNALPTTGKCEGTWTWHIERGTFGETSLDDLNFTVCVNWPGAIHEGNGEALILVDERSDEAQRKAIETLVGGDAGGPWGVLAWTWPTIHGPKPVPYDVHIDGVNSRVKAGDSYEVVSETIKNPVSGDGGPPGRSRFPRESCSRRATSVPRRRSACRTGSRSSIPGSTRPSAPSSTAAPRRECAPATTPAPTSTAATRRHRGRSSS